MNTRKLYTNFEIRYFLKYHNKFPYSYFAKKFKRTIKSIKHLTKRLALSKNTILSKKDQEQKIIQYFQVQGKNKRLLKTKEALSKIKNKSFIEIAKYLNMTPSGLRNHRKKLGIFKYKFVSKKEIKFITKNYSTMSIELLAKEVGRTKNAVRVIALRNGATKRFFWKSKEIAYLRNNLGKQSLEQIAKKLNRTPRAIQVRLQILKISTAKSTLIETQCEEILKELGIPFKSQVTIKNKDCPKTRYRLDFLLFKKFVIETYGNFWHCNPSMYPKPIYKLQKENIEKGLKKEAYLKKNGYKLLIIWESEFKNLENVKKKILASIKKLGNIGKRPEEENTEISDSITKGESTS